MVAKKDYLKKKLDEKKTEILLQIIEEEVEKAYSELLIEQDYDENIGVGVDSDSGTKGGIKRIWADRSKLPGLLISPLVDAGAAFKKFFAKVGIAATGLIGMTIAGAIAALLPFNDPRTVKWIGKNFLAWESKSMKFIDEQFKYETDKIRQGWETFKNDFWGIGFVASPFGAIAAAATAMKGVDAALSVSNIITGGKVGSLLSKINLEVEDPGTLEEYLRKGKSEDRDKQRKEEEKLEKEMYTDRCLANLEDPNWLDPECVGFAKRSMFTPDKKGENEFVDFVTNNARTLSYIRQKQYKIQFGKDPKGQITKGLEDVQVIRALKNAGIVKNENYVHNPTNKKIIIQEEKINIEEGLMNLFNKVKGAFSKKPEKNAAAGDKKPAGDFDSDFAAAMSGAPSKVSAAEQIAIMQKKFGPEKTNELLKKIIESLVADPTAKAAEQQWSAANLPKAMGAFSDLNNSILSGQVPNITIPQVQQYEKQAGNIAAASVTQTAKFPIPPDRLNLVKQIAQTNAQRDLAPLNKVIAQQPQTPPPAAPAQQQTDQPQATTTAAPATTQQPTQPVAQPQQS